MLKQTLLATLLLTALAAADVTLVSGCPTDVRIRLGEREENLEPRQSLTLTGSEAVSPLVVSAHGKTLYTARLTDNRFWVVNESGTPRGAVGFFNATPYTIVLHLTAETETPTQDPEPIRVPSMQVSRPADLPSGDPFSIGLEDERGSPLGTC